MRSEHERLLDILEAIERIEKYAARGKTTFDEFENQYPNHFILIGYTITERIFCLRWSQGKHPEAEAFGATDAVLEGLLEQGGIFGDQDALEEDSEVGLPALVLACAFVAAL